MEDIERVAVLGMGTMGAGIAQSVAGAGYEVVALETDAARAAAGEAAVRRFLGGGVARGKVTEAELAATVGRITAVTDVSELDGADLVIEAIVEDRDAKHRLLGTVAAVVGESCGIVTNTSALSVSELATAVPSPDRFAGLHFFNPAPLMTVVEVVRAVQSAPELVELLERFVETLGKTPVVVTDRPGFLVNHLLMPYLNDVVQAYDDGLASAEDIDVALRLGLGYKLGPLELLDMVGLDVHCHATEHAYEATGDVRFKPPPLLRQMVLAGRLGDKSGQGFRTPAPGGGSPA